MEKRKYIGRPYKDYIKSFESKIIRVDTESLKGYAAHIKVIEANRPFMVGAKGAEICIADDGYSSLEFLPDNENWGVFAAYNADDKIVEWYFDITRKNALDNEGQPYSVDLYLDIVLTPDGKILVLDEDELTFAYKEGLVSEEELKMAYHVKDELIDKKIVDVAYMEQLCSELFYLFQT